MPKGDFTLLVYLISKVFIAVDYGKISCYFSRAHTIVGITFVQKFQNAAGEETTKTAVTNLVDLAGR